MFFPRTYSLLTIPVPSFFHSLHLASPEIEGWIKTIMGHEAPTVKCSFTLNEGKGMPATESVTT